MNPDETKRYPRCHVVTNILKEQWCSGYKLLDQEVRGSISGLVATISEIISEWVGYLLLQSRNMAEISLKQRKSSKKQPTKQ